MLFVEMRAIQFPNKFARIFNLKYDLGHEHMSINNEMNVSAVRMLQFLNKDFHFSLAS